MPSGRWLERPRFALKPRGSKGHSRGAGLVARPLRCEWALAPQRAALPCVGQGWKRGRPSPDE
eukprot:2274976-Pyramimonas_sp.AAC.1